MNTVVLPEALRRFVWKARGYRYRRTLGAPVVLLYHRVGDEAFDPLLLSVSRQNFALQMAFLKERCHVLPPVDFAEKALNGTLPANAVAITFDDGYADNLHNAAPLMKEQGFQGTVFVATSRIHSEEAPWWDYLDQCLLRPDVLPSELVLETPSGRMAFSIDGISDESRGWDVTQAPRNGRQRAYLSLQFAFLGWKPTAQRQVQAQLVSWSGVPPALDSYRRFMSASEILDCANGGVLEIGAHTVNHPRVNLLEAAELQSELEGSRATLASLTGVPPKLFAFPFGTVRDYDAKALRAVKRAGFQASFANMPARADAFSNRWELPRVLVRNWGPVEFAQQLGLS